MGRLHPVLLVEWECQHQRKTATNRLGEHDLVQVSDPTCRRCGLKVKTEERLAVPWDEHDLVEQVKALLPEGQAVALRDKGFTIRQIQPHLTYKTAGGETRNPSIGAISQALKAHDGE